MRILPMSTLLSQIILALALLSACSSEPGGNTASPAAPVAGLEVVATVNGVAITSADVEFASLGKGHGSDTKLDPRGVLETLIREELAAQRALALGLEPDAAYRKELARLEAQVAAYKRKRLSELLYAKAVADAKPTEADARTYFERNAALIRREVHVWQILKRDEATISALQAEIAAGAPFDEVAARSFGDLPPEAGKPWDLGYLPWDVVPKPWRKALDGLAVGGTSGVISGPSSRFWVIKLVAERENPAVTFESSREAIMKVLEAEKLETARADIDRELRGAATIVFPATRPAPAPAPHPTPAPIPE